MSDFHLIVRELSKNFGKIEALKRAHFSVKKGIITSFLGENGAGKTTTMKCIFGFLKRCSGTIEIKAQRIGYVPEFPVFFNWLKGKEIISYTSRLHGIPKERLERQVEKYSEKIGFEPQLLSRKVHTYSLGNQKKFSYLQSLIIYPDFFVIDEPFYSLDPITIKKIRDLFLELKEEGVSLFISSHILSEVEKITDEIIIVRKGIIIIQKNLRDFKDNFIFFQLDRNGIEKKQLYGFTPFIKEKDACFDLFLNKKYLQSFEKFLKKKGKTASKKNLNLEKIFFFFTK